jgi:hypothetical protein
MQMNAAKFTIKKLPGNNTSNKPSVKLLISLIFVLS